MGMGIRRRRALLRSPRRGLRASVARGCAGRLAGLGLALGLAACERRSPPDVILIVVDTLRAQNVSTLGYERDTTPNLTRFAADAITYEDAISTGTWTVPSHGSLFTGLLPSYHGAERVAADRNLVTPINPEVATLAEILRAHGYRTAGFIANSTYLTPTLGFARGFEKYSPEEGLTAAVGNRALDWLAGSPRPTFLFLNVLDPHEPYEPPPPYDTSYPGKRSDLGNKMTDLYWKGTELTPDVRRHFESQYDGEISYTDEALEGLLARLRDLGRYDESLIILTSDHGELLGEHGLAGHGADPFQELVHVPLFVKMPRGADAGTRVARRVSTLGVFATILDAAGVPLPAGNQSVHLARPQEVWTEDVSWFGQRITAGYDGDMKLVRREKTDALRERTDLYALDRDPDETKPLDLAKAPALVERMRRFREAPRPTNAAPPPLIDPERERKLRELGYIH
jgi:arylsulfatase A-like enzyme